KNLLWKFLGITIVVGFAIWKLVPPDKTINLGLDLQGGMHLVLQVETGKAVEFETDRVNKDIQKTLDEKDIRYDSIQTRGEDELVIVFTHSDSRYRAGDLIAKAFTTLQVQQEETKKLVYKLKEAEVKRIAARAHKQALEVIRKRVDRFGVSEPSIQSQGKDRIVVQLPGIKDLARAERILKKTALLEFRLVSDDTEKLKEALEGTPPPGYEVLYMIVYDKNTGEQQIPFLVKKKPELTGAHLVDARPTFGSQLNQPEVSFTLDRSGGKIFSVVTEKNIERKLAIILDGEIQSAPVIRSKIPSGRGVITGRFSPEEAKDLAVILTAGALPAPVKILQNIRIGPSLGRDSIRKGITSALFGFAVVIIFMMIYYLLAGVIADFALCLNIILILGALAFLKATLTLPGIAGIILTIGMAVDANVLIFERIREEMSIGKRVRTAIETGFDRAKITILDANITTFFTAAVLYTVGTGPVQGFAVTLMWGIVSSLFTSLIVSRTIFEMMGLRKSFEKLRMLSFFGKTNIDFIGRRYYAYIISGVLILAGMTMFSIRGSQNFGVDFTGGDLIQLRFEKPVTADLIREKITEIGYGDSTIQMFGDNQEVLIRTKFEKGQEIEDHLKESITDNPFEERRLERIGPAIGSDLRQKAVYALFYAMLVIIVYVAWRFGGKGAEALITMGIAGGLGWLAIKYLPFTYHFFFVIVIFLLALAICWMLKFEFAMGAIIALVHDVLITLGFFAFTGRELSLPVVAALLTIIGYSLNDTIVVFDRIREDMKLMKKSNLDIIINTSINQTLSRTILTSLTTLFVVASLYFFGGKVINDFAFALLIGVMVGTYSSIYVASPIILEWHRKAANATLELETAGKGKKNKKGKKK
ncbi:MAG: protein translocase subunit SecD, partial [Candidatus Theseobacter exili]|nr:protein translocase subunit SecD [Candidatus Theseobacter exili]